ncbi:glycosyltransferase family 4 protein, partial [Gemmatimonadota bacterium]
GNEQKKAGIEGRVLLRDRVPHGELPMYYASSDLFVFASRWEVFGMVLLEALSCGLPVASTPVGGATMLAAHESGVSLFPIGDRRALADLMLRDGGSEAKVSARAVGEKYSWDVVAESCLRSLL